MVRDGLGMAGSGMQGCWALPPIDTPSAPPFKPRPLGLLPKAYSAAAGGTRAAPPELNGRNRKSAALVLTDASACAFLVGLPAPGQRVTGDVEDAGVWRLLREAPFVDHSRSRFPWRSFWLPGAAARNTWGRYQLWRNEGLLGPCPDVLRPAL